MSGPIGRRKKGERVLASATTLDGVLVAGTRDTLLIGARRIPWEGLQSADWDKESTTLRVAEVGDWARNDPSTSSSCRIRAASWSWSANGSRRASYSSGTWRCAAVRVSS